VALRIAVLHGQAAWPMPYMGVFPAQRGLILPGNYTAILSLGIAILRFQDEA
jgi:hypothetical protein